MAYPPYAGYGSRQPDLYDYGNIAPSRPYSSGGSIRNNSLGPLQLYSPYGSHGQPGLRDGPSSSSYYGSGPGRIDRLDRFSEPHWDEDEYGRPSFRQSMPRYDPYGSQLSGAGAGAGYGSYADPYADPYDADRYGSPYADPYGNSSYDRYDRYGPYGGHYPAQPYPAQYPPRLQQQPYPARQHAQVYGPHRPSFAPPHGPLPLYGPHQPAPFGPGPYPHHWTTHNSHAASSFYYERSEEAAFFAPRRGVDILVTPFG